MRSTHALIERARADKHDRDDARSPQTAGAVGQRSRRPPTRAVVGGLLVALAAVGAFVLATPGDPALTEYVVAAHAIDPGARFDPSDLTTTALDLPPDLAALAYTDASTLAGSDLTRPDRRRPARASGRRRSGFAVAVRGVARARRRPRPRQPACVRRARGGARHVRERPRCRDPHRGEQRTRRADLEAHRPRRGHRGRRDPRPSGRGRRRKPSCTRRVPESSRSCAPTLRRRALPTDLRFSVPRRTGCRGAIGDERAVRHPRARSGPVVMVHRPCAHGAQRRTPARAGEVRQPRGGARPAGVGPSLLRVARRWRPSRRRSRPHRRRSSGRGRGARGRRPEGQPRLGRTRRHRRPLPFLRGGRPARVPVGADAGDPAQHRRHGPAGLDAEALVGRADRGHRSRRDGRLDDRRRARTRPRRSAGPRGAVLLADLALDADQGVLHHAPDIVPGLPELVEAHRAGSLSASAVHSMVFDVEERGYHLLLGLRRRRGWASLRPRALEARSTRCSPRIRSSSPTSIPTSTATTSAGRSRSRSAMQIARATLARATATVVVGSATIGGLHSLAEVLRDLLRTRCRPRRIVPVVNHAPRAPRQRAAIARALPMLGAVGTFDDEPRPRGAGVRACAAGRGGRRERRTCASRARRDAGDAAVGGLLEDRELIVDLTEQPVRVAPGSLGHWSDTEADAV